MKRSTLFTFLLVVGLTTAAPATDNSDDDKIVITKDFFPESLVKYTSKHEIVNILVPINSINFDEISKESSSSEESDTEITLFFVEADIDASGKRIDQGLYLFKNNVTKKLLDHGRDATASADDDHVYFGAQDGIYVYKDETAVKYGSLTDNIIGIVKANSSAAIYILTEDHEVFKVTDGGNKKEKVESVVGAQQIMLDYSNNLYFYAQDKEAYVLTPDGVKKIEGLPTNPTEVNLLKPPFIFDDAVPFIVDNTAYFIYANGSSETTDFEFANGAKPSAYAMEAALIQYYAYDKKIYEYNILAILLHEILSELKKYLSDKTDTIQSLATSRRKFTA